MIGGTLMGILGALIALPIAAGAVMLVRELRLAMPGDEPTDGTVRAEDAKEERIYERLTVGANAADAGVIAGELVEKHRDRAARSRRGLRHGMRSALHAVMTTRANLMSGLVGGIIDDARDAVGAGVDALRGEMDDRLAKLGTAMVSMMIAMVILIVMAGLCGVAIAASLVAVGLPLWGALWVATAVAALLSVTAVRRAKRTPPAPAIA